MIRYDPESAPDPDSWLATPESDRLDAVRRHHRKARQRSGSPKAHAAIHLTVENQLAQGHPAACAAMTRLMSEGLDRHEALHAIGSIVAGDIFDVVRSNRRHDPEAYRQRLGRLTAQSWRTGEIE
jgi:hypothetical protein